MLKVDRRHPATRPGRILTSLVPRPLDRGRLPSRLLDLEDLGKTCRQSLPLILHVRHTLNPTLPFLPPPPSEPPVLSQTPLCFSSRIYP